MGGGKTSFLALFNKYYMGFPPLFNTSFFENL